MSEPFVGEIRMFGFNFAPKGWAFCSGQILPIQQNTALFSLLGITYGGDGRSTFALPNLQGRAPLFWGQGPGLSDYSQGQTGGTTTVTLAANQMPAHNHPMSATTTNGSQLAPAGNIWAQDVGGANFYAPTATSPMNATIVGQAGGGQAHDNMQPYLAVNFCIALQGIFPARN